MRKSVLIVGGSSGIGRAIALKFAENNYDVFVSYNNSEVEDLKFNCENLGARFESFKLNVKFYSDYEKLFAWLKNEAEYLDCVVYCAGLSLDEKLLFDENLEDIDDIIDVNLKGGIYCAKEAAQYFSKIKHGSIIFISSIYGIYGGACESVYSAAKGGLIALSKALSQECGNFNVRVNCVAPGCIETKMTEKYIKTEKEQLESVTPMRRIGQPEDVASTVFFLASDEASFITGEVITVSGGAVRF